MWATFPHSYVYAIFFLARLRRTATSCLRHALTQPHSPRSLTAGRLPLPHRQPDGPNLFGLERPPQLYPS